MFTKKKSSLSLSFAKIVDCLRKGRLGKEEKNLGSGRKTYETMTVISVGIMEISYSQYPPHLIHTILQQYQKGVRGKGFRALAKKYEVKGGHQLISFWYSKWDGTESSLKKHSGGDTRSTLTEKEKKVHIHDFIEKKSKTEAVTYPEVKVNVEKKTKKAPSLTAVKRIGKSQKITSKKRKRVLKSQGRSSL